MTWIKICGITNLEDAMAAAHLRMDALGFIFAPSPRRVELFVAREIIGHLPESVLKVGVFVNEDLAEVARIADYCGLDMIQLHGQETPEYCLKVALPVIKAIRVKDSESLKEMEKYPFASILLDAWSAEQAGGTGKTFHWEMAVEARKKMNIILSGGLNPGNVRQAVRILRPFGVDVCSGVERSAGKKDLFKMADFVKEVKKTDEST